MSEGNVSHVEISMWYNGRSPGDGKADEIVNMNHPNMLESAKELLDVHFNGECGCVSDE